MNTRVLINENVAKNLNQYLSDNAPKIIPEATPEMLNKRSIALAELRALGGLQDIIPDPITWQQEIRIERSLFERS